MYLANVSAAPYSVSSDFGQLVVKRHFTSGVDCATAGAATAAVAAPTPAALRKSRRFIGVPLIRIRAGSHLGPALRPRSIKPLRNSQYYPWSISRKRPARTAPQWELGFPKESTSSWGAFRLIIRSARPQSEKRS